MALARVTIHLPADANGRSPRPGDVIDINPNDPAIEGHLQRGHLVLTDPGPMPDALKPPRHRAGQRPADDAA